MKKLLLIALLPITALAQVNLCLDQKGRKTYTEAECEEIGMQPVGVIKDIRPKANKCYEMEGRIKTQRDQVEKLRATRGDFNTGQTMAILIEGEVKRIETEYKRECKR